MKRTRFGSLLLVTGWGSFLMALVLHTLAPALFGLLLVILVAAARPPVINVEVTRIVPETVNVGDAFEVTTNASAPGSGPLFIEDPPPEGLTVLESRQEAHRGQARQVVRVLADRSGVVLWSSARVRYQDDWGVLEGETSVPVFSQINVRPSTDAIPRGARAGRKVSLNATSRGRTGFSLEAEVERLRPYIAGDRMRDIAWTQVAKLQRLVTREFRRESPRPLVLLLQATPSMRRERKANKFATCAETALGLLAAGRVQGIGVGLVAYSEEGVVAQVRAGQGRRAVQDAVASISDLPAPIVRDDIAPPSRGLKSRSPSVAERAFLRATHPRQGATTPLESAFGALARVASQPSIVVAFLDAEESPELVAVVARRLKSHGHRLIVVAPASGAHHYSLREVDDEILDRLALWRRNREQAARRAADHHAPFLTLGPRLDEGAIREVLESAA